MKVNKNTSYLQANINQLQLFAYLLFDIMKTTEDYELRIMNLSLTNLLIDSLVENSEMKNTYFYILSKINTKD